MHEVLVTLLAIVLAAGALCAIAYIWTLGRFFAELKAREPDVWARVGSPRILDMLVLPVARFRKYYGFLPVLRERAALRRSEYRYAVPAYRLLRAGLVLTVVLFAMAAALAALTLAAPGASR